MFSLQPNHINFGVCFHFLIDWHILIDKSRPLYLKTVVDIAVIHLEPVDLLMLTIAVN